MRFALLSAALLCLSLSFAQQPEGEPIAPPTPTPGSKAAMQALQTEMQGAWRLKRVESPALDPNRRQEVGFLLVSGSHFSFEMHMSWTSPDARIAKRTSLSGTHSFELDELLHMSARLVIGSTIDDVGMVAWEQPGKLRKYDVACATDVLRLTREDGTLFEFERLTDSKTPRDIYGRPLKLKDPNDPKKKN